MAAAASVAHGAIGRRIRGRDRVYAGERLQQVDVAQQGSMQSSLAASIADKPMIGQSVPKSSQAAAAATAAVGSNLQLLDLQASEQLKPLARIQSRSSVSNGVTHNLTEISSDESSKTYSKITRNQKQTPTIIPKPNNSITSITATTSEDEEGPLIHTDKLNASSPLLYVFHSGQAKRSRVSEPMDEVLASGSSNQPISNSQFSPSRVSILSAVGKRAVEAEHDETRQQQQRRRQPIAGSGRNNDHPGSLVPRLVVLNLEVGSSTATLAWSLSLIPSGSGAILTPSASIHQVSFASAHPRLLVDDGKITATATTTSDKKKELVAQQSQQLLSQQKQQTTAAEGNNEQKVGEGAQVSPRANLKPAALSDGIGPLTSDSVALPQSQYQQQLLLTTPPPAANQKQVNETPMAGGDSFRVKRDTIKVVPTLRRVPLVQAFLNKSGNSSGGARYKKAMNHSSEEEAFGSGDENNEDELSPEKREMVGLMKSGNLTGSGLPTVATTGVRQTIDSSSDLLRLSNSNNEPQQANTSRPTTTITTTTTTSTIRPNGGSPTLAEQQKLGPDLPVSARLQLSQVRTLPASTNNRRPPMRPSGIPLASNPRVTSESSDIRPNSELQSSSSTRAQLPQESTSTTIAAAAAAAGTTTTPATSITTAPSLATSAPSTTTTTTTTEARPQPRPTTGSLFRGRWRNMNRLTSVAGSDDSWPSTSTTTTSAPSSQPHTNIPRSSQRAVSPIIRTVSLQLNRIPTAAPSTTATPITAASASTSAETTPAETTSAETTSAEKTSFEPTTTLMPTTSASITTTTPTPTTTATTTTTRKPLVTEQRAAKSLSGFASSADSRNSITTLVTESSIDGEHSSNQETQNATTMSNSGRSSQPDMQRTKSLLISEPSSLYTSTLVSPTPEVTIQQPSSIPEREPQSVAIAGEKQPTPTDSATKQADKRPTKVLAPETVEVSKWLIRLRRFATNEVDIVKVVVNNLRQFALQQQQQHQHPALRYILFKNLEPSSAYEICIESASPNQQVEDKFKILDANHFLKCHDTTDVELSDLPDTTTQQQQQQHNGTSLRRMDLNQITASKADEPLALTLVQQDPGLDQQDSTPDAQVKMKSLCKEFFTLNNNNSLEKINYGQFESLDSNRLNVIESSASSMVSRKVKAPTDGSFVDLTISTNDTAALSANANLTSTVTTATTNLAGLRRPKSLQNSLKSHMELLEINDLGSSLGGSREPAPGANMFEILASRNPQSSLNSRLSSLASSTTTTTATTGQNIDQPINRSHGPPDSKIIPSLAPNQDYLNLSVLPIVGCIFALIFLVTLANIVLSAINCNSKLNSRRRRAQNRTESRLGFGVGGGGGGGGGLLARDGESRQHALGSFYSDTSDNSNGGSQSRIVVVGKNHEPFTGASAYFELPDEGRLMRPGSDLGAGQIGAHSPQGSGGKLSASSYLLSSASRFPLGPSFEGDERHNADMVGLARKNYDNFINHIYNADLAETTMDALHGAHLSQAHSSPGSQHQHVSLGVGGASHHYHASRRHPSRELDSYRLSDISRGVAEKTSGGLLPTTANNGASNGATNNGVTASGDLGGGGGGNNTNKKQRLRFDKINPIYNMNGLQYTSPTRICARSPIGGISSFGHTNQALVSSDELHPVARQSHDSNRIIQMKSTTTDEQQCPLCEPETHQSEQHFELEDDERDCDCGENSTQFSCCLDRQKQRFEKQQQQLERVMSRNGSLVPQPFINPTGPPRCGSPSCQAVAHDHDLLVAASGATKNDGQDESLMTNSDKSESETLINSNNGPQSAQDGANSVGANDKPSDFFLFGEGDLQEQGPIESNDISLGQEEQIVFPPPPPAPPAAIMADLGYSTIKGGSSGSKTLVKLGTMSSGNSASTSVGNNANETINKTDFNQRRNELASKLQFAGMMLRQNESAS